MGYPVDVDEVLSVVALLLSLGHTGSCSLGAATQPYLKNSVVWYTLSLKDERVYREVFSNVNMFLKNYYFDLIGKEIMVHCTHGANRNKERSAFGKLSCQTRIEKNRVFVLSL